MKTELEVALLAREIVDRSPVMIPQGLRGQVAQLVEEGFYGGRHDVIELVNRAAALLRRPDVRLELTPRERNAQQNRANGFERRVAANSHQEGDGL